MTQRRIYQNEYPYFVTFRTREGFRLFENVEMAGLMSRVIFKTCDLKRFDVLAFQTMPDHVHILVNKIATAPAAGCGVRINTPRAQPAVVARPSKKFTISDLMHGIKSYYCEMVRNELDINFPFFQKRFYTRIVDTPRYLETVIHYIQNNPTKAELSERFKKPPYQFIDWKKIYTLF